MPSRGIIARPVGDGWMGVYHHEDSQPTHLGPRLYEQWKFHFNCETDRLLMYAIDRHMGGWASFPGRCYCHSLGGAELTRSRNLVFNEGDRCEASTCNPLFLEWVYVLDGHHLQILATTPSDPDDECAAAYPQLGRFFRHYPVGSFDLTQGEPDWASLPKREAITSDRIAQFVP